MLVISFSLVNMFDSIGTLLGAAKQSGMIDENGEVIRMKLLVGRRQEVKVLTFTIAFVFIIRYAFITRG